MEADQEILFAKTLEKVKKQARDQGNAITREQVGEAFAGLSLSQEQLSLVFDYLENVCRLMEQSVPHYILHFTLSVNSPTKEE